MRNQFSFVPIQYPERTSRPRAADTVRYHQMNDNHRRVIILTSLLCASGFRVVSDDKPLPKPNEFESLCGSCCVPPALCAKNGHYYFASKKGLKTSTHVCDDDGGGRCSTPPFACVSKQNMHDRGRSARTIVMVKIKHRNHGIEQIHQQFFRIINKYIIVEMTNTTLLGSRYKILS